MTIFIAVPRSEIDYFEEERSKSPAVTSAAARKKESRKPGKKYDEMIPSP